MARKNPPLLIFGGLTNTVYVVTRYTDLGNGNYKAHEKFDVTAQFVDLGMGDARSLLAGQNDRVKDDA